MNDAIDAAFEGFDKCMKIFEEGVEKVLKNAFKKKGIKIKIKKGSIIYLGNNVYAKLRDDTFATIHDEKV